MAAIKEVLDIDSQYRTVGVTDDLYTIDTLISGKSLEYDLPTLVNRSFEYHKTTNLVTSAREFAGQYYSR